MRIITHLIVLFFLLLGSAHAQPSSGQFVDGPTQACVDETSLYALTDSVFIFISEVSVQIINGCDPLITLSADGQVFVNWICPGNYVLTFEIGDDVGQIVAIDSIEVEVTSFIDIPIVSTATALCPGNTSGGSGNPNGSCEKVCAYSTVTYTVPSTSNIYWEVLGAEDFQVDGNAVTVDWGPPGNGQVSATVADSICSFNVECFVSYSQGPGVNEIELSAILDCGQAPYTFLWTDNTGNASTGQTLIVPIDVASQSVFQLTVTDANGQTATCSYAFSFDPNCQLPLLLNLEVVDESFCGAGDGSITPVIFGGSGPDNLFYQWSTGSSTAAIQGLASGDYCVTVFDELTGCETKRCGTVECPSGCSGSNSICVDVIENPDASIETTPPIINGVIEICKGQTIFFNNTTTGAETYVWDFGDNNTTSDSDPEKKFTNAGTFEVQLIARNECFCSDTATITVIVLDTESPSINCVGTICEGETVTYSTDANCGTFIWTVSANGTVLDGGDPADDFVTVEWTSGPEGTITLLAEGCPGVVCDDPVIEKIGIISDNAQIEGPEKVCLGEVASYTIPKYDGTGITWSVSGGGTIAGGQNSSQVTVQWSDIITPPSPQWVAVEYDNCYLDCGGRDTLFLNILTEFYVEGPIEACESSSSIFQSKEISGANMFGDWAVYAPDGSQMSSFPSANAISVDWNMGPGRYTVEATASNPDNYCRDIYRTFVLVRSGPLPALGMEGPELICPGVLYTYEVVPSQPNVSFSWTINNGGVITNRKGPRVNVAWVATQPYSISVSQVSTDGLFCESDPVEKTVKAITSVDISGLDEVCQETTTQYSATSFEKLSYDWNIIPLDAGTIVDGKNTETVEVLWHKAGPAIISLSVCGQFDQIIVFVNGRPDPAVNHPAAVCAGETTLVNTTLAYTDYQWENENGALVSDQPSPTISPGYYHLIVTDNKGCVGDATFQVIEHPESFVTIDVPIYLGLCPGGPSITISALNTDVGYDYQWFQDGNPVGSNAPTFSTNQMGSYLVEITDKNGCVKGSNVINLADCESLGGICVNGTCVAPGGGGSGGGGCTPDGSISFQIDPTADCNTHLFTNTSVNFIPGSFQWNFGDPTSGIDNTSTDFSPSHTFTGGPGFYSIIMLGEVPDANVPGATCTILRIRNDTVRAFADFEVESACPGSPAQFRDLTTFMPFSSITAWSWDFGDPASGPNNISADSDPTHIYDASGVYAVTLTVTDVSGCQTSTTKDVTIFDRPSVSFDLPAANCERTALPFLAMTSPDALSVEWNFDDALSGSANASELDTTFHAFSLSGNFDVILTATNIYGCENTHSETITIEPNGLGGQIIATIPPPLCEGDSTTLMAPLGGTTWEWSNGSATEDITVGEEEVYSVTVTDDKGCTYSPTPFGVQIIAAPEAVIKAVEYNDFGLPANFFFNNLTICEGEEVYLEVVGNQQYSYQWSNGLTLTEIEFTDDRGNLLPVGTHEFTVIVTDQTSGCTSLEGPFTVEVNPLPVAATFSVNPPTPICEGTLATFSVDNPEPQNIYIWNTGQTGEQITASTAGEYFVRVISDLGCEAKSDSVIIWKGPDISKIPTGCHARCNPDAMCLPALPNVVAYQWYFNNSPIPGPGGTSANPVFDQSGDYYVEMTDLIGCMTASESLNIELFDGFGNVKGQVYVDVNQNGIIDAGDTLIGGIQLILTDGINPLDTVVTDASGSYSFPDFPAANYVVVIDTNALPPGLAAVYNFQDVIILGCDVEETINGLVVLNCAPSFTSLDLNACPGEMIDYNGQPLLAGTTTDFNFTSVEGCDSTVSVTVSPLPTDASSLNLEACEGSTADYNGQQLPAGSATDFTFDNQSGCDSVVTVTVNTLFPDQNSLTLQACEGSTAEYNGQQLPAGSTTDFNFQNQNGCDSVVTVTVNTLFPDQNSLTLQACEGSTAEYNGQQLPAGSTTDFNFQNQNGCDSVVTVTVNTLFPDQTAIQLQGCPGSFVDYEGLPLPAGSQTDFSYTNQSGCDSTVTVTVEELIVSETDLNLQACPEGSVQYQAMELFPGDERQFILTGQDGCDSLVNVIVSAFPSFVLETTVSEPSCWNAPSGTVMVNVTSGNSPPYSYSSNGIDFLPDNLLDGLSGGSQTLFVQDGNGCVQSQEVTIDVIPAIQVDSTGTVFPCKTKTVRLEPVAVTNGLDFVWQDGSVNSFFEAGGPGIYSVQVTNKCETVNAQIQVRLADDSIATPLYVPNIFSPNSDGRNDVFEIQPAADVEVLKFHLEVFDRWGTRHFMTENVETHWDGTTIDRLRPGVYVWFLKARVFSCGREYEVFDKGDVTVVR